MKKKNHQSKLYTLAPCIARLHIIAAQCKKKPIKYFGWKLNIGPIPTARRYVALSKKLLLVLLQHVGNPPWNWTWKAIFFCCFAPRSSIDLTFFRQLATVESLIIKQKIVVAKQTLILFLLRWKLWLCCQTLLVCKICHSLRSPWYWKPFHSCCICYKLW